MAAQVRVQDYLQTHKIGSLFEDLMAKVVNDMPDDPIIYLARILQFRADKRDGKSALSKSANFDAIAVAKKSPGYDKPWQPNSKRLKPKENTDIKTGKKSLANRPEWDGKKIKSSTSFDDIWDDSKGMRKSRDGRPTSPSGGKVTVSGIAAWADANMEQEGEELMFSAYGYRGPQKGRKESDDPLAGELGLIKTRQTKSSTDDTPLSSTKRKGRNVNSSRHKEQLKNYIRQSEQKTQDSGIEDDRDLENDDAIELMEDPEELRREGVKNVKKSGVRISTSLRRAAAPAPNIRVSICARCAKVMGGGEPSQPSPDFDAHGGFETERTYGASQPASARFESPPSDDEFESVSQVTGPRRPVWQESDNEAVTPRKGKHMLGSNMSPSKGRPMYSGGTPKAGKKASGTAGKSHDFYEHTPGSGPHSEPMRSTWSPAAGQEYSEGAPATAATQDGATARSQTVTKDEDLGRSEVGASSGWQLPPDYDTDSSFYGSPGGQKGKRVDRAY